ncbi:MAG: SAF domain-containing protein [Nitriliruptoraceae bacterium]
MPRDLLRHLHGPPVVLPRAIDRLSERWWRARPRARTAAMLALAMTLLLAGSVRSVLGPQGPPVDVVVATRDLEPGMRIHADDVTLVRRARDATPPGSLSAPSDVVGHTVHLPVVRGAVVTARHVTVSGISGLVPPGTVAVPVDPTLVAHVPVGTHLDLVARDATVLATNASVIARTEDVVWVAVPDGHAGPAAAAAASGQLTVVVHPAERIVEE